MEEKEKQILNATEDVFLRYGIKSVTMDDVAKELKISKKTLYKYFNNKTDLVTKIFDNYCRLDVDAINFIHKESANAIEELIEIWKHTSEKIKKIHPSIHFDLEKYYPEVWGKFNLHKLTFIADSVRRNLIRGVDEGLFRKNININILTRLYVSRIDVIFDARIFPANEFSFEDVYLELIRYHIRGIASDEGIAYLINLVQKNTIKFI